MCNFVLIRLEKEIHFSRETVMTNKKLIIINAIILTAFIIVVSTGIRHTVASKTKLVEERQKSVKEKEVQTETPELPSYLANYFSLKKQLLQRDQLKITEVELDEKAPEESEKSEIKETEDADIEDGHEDEATEVTAEAEDEIPASGPSNSTPAEESDYYYQPPASSSIGSDSNSPVDGTKYNTKEEPIKSQVTDKNKEKDINKKTNPKDEEKKEADSPDDKDGKIKSEEEGVEGEGHSKDKSEDNLADNPKDKKQDDSENGSHEKTDKDNGTEIEKSDQNEGND